MPGQDLPAVRARWQELLREPRTEVLRVALLASFTIDPVLPYLGVALEDAGLPMASHVGPYNQIVQQCLDDDSPTARHRPDVLVVAPRFEELGEEDDHVAGLRHVVGAADAAASRWGALLVVVLPPHPARRAGGVLGEGLPGVATAAREAVRERLARRPDVLVVDAEQAVRAVGARQAHHEAMFRFAKVPYTEPVFAELGARLAGALRAAFGAVARAVVVDGDAPRVAELEADLAVLRRAGVHVGLTASGHGGWTGMADVLDSWSIGEPPADVLVVREPADLDRAGAFDRLPGAAPAPRGPGEAEQPGGLSLDDFVAGLGVEVSCEPVAADTAAKVAEVVSRAKDFTLGGDADLDFTGPGRELLAVQVKDRLGDYGLSGAVGLRRDGEDWVVDVFSLSCPVLGKGVQDKVLADIVARTGGRVAFRHHRTPHNDVATRFLADTGVRVEEVR